jgi:O-antigen ligase
MIIHTIKFILILLLIFTPIAFGSMELWAFSMMELGVLLLIMLWSIHNIRYSLNIGSFNKSAIRTPNSAFPTLILFLFVAFVFLQMIPIPAGILKTISPKTYELRHVFANVIPQSEIRNPQFPISFMPLATKIEFFKWLTLIAFFLFLVHWKYFGNGFRITNQLIIVIFLMGVFESLYGMFEFFSGHHHILHLKGISCVTGTFINRNYFAGYLLMVIPLCTGFFFSREALHVGRFKGWRQRLSSLDGKTLLIGFGIIVMILGLLFSASRMGILSLLLSFTLISILFKTPQKRKGFSKTSLLILGLALLWAVWIGLDAVIGRFFNVTEDLRSRWTIWVNAFKIVKDFPILGTGLGTFTQVFPMYRSFHIRRLVTHAENDFLQLSSEVGLILIGLLLILFIFFFFRAVSGMRALSHSESQRYIGIGGLVGVLALMFHSMVERNLQIPANAFLYTFIWALVLRTGSFKQSERATAGEIR